ncbi:hypothetical protein [Salibacterium salarium]|uniref:hypothetical protein n=1 Tax=Salibacterium salarium TaxID=284579 RepID=UPI001639D07E|nr:hypothetical protein [Salibacterium salarium]
MHETPIARIKNWHQEASEKLTALDSRLLELEKNKEQDIVTLLHLMEQKLK